MTATIWNTADKSANITLSGGSLTATTSSSTQGAVRATNSFSSGKLYFECQLQVLAGSAFAIGWANSTAVLGTAMGTDKNSVVVQAVGGTILFNNVSQGTLPAAVTLLVVGVAFDITNTLIWFRTDAGLWNGSVTANPATGTGGISLATMNAGPYFPVFAANSSGASVLANFGATDFDYAAPSGFSGLDTDTQTYMAAAKFLGYDLLAPPLTGINASKFLGYDLLAPPLTGINASKFLGYVILQTLPNTTFSRARQLVYLRM